MRSHGHPRLPRARRSRVPAWIHAMRADGRAGQGSGHRLLVHFQGYTTAPAMLEWRAAGELRGVWDAQRVDDFLRQQQPQQQSAAPAAHHSPLPVDDLHASPRAPEPRRYSLLTAEEEGALRSPPPGLGATRTPEHLSLPPSPLAACAADAAAVAPSGDAERTEHWNVRALE